MTTEDADSTSKLVHCLLDKIYELEIASKLTELFVCDGVSYLKVPTEIKKDIYMELRRVYYGHDGVEEWFSKKHEELTGGEK